MSDEDFNQLNNIETQNHLKLFLYKSVIQKIILWKHYQLSIF